LVTPEHNNKATEILVKVAKGPHVILVVPSGFSLGTENPGLTLKALNAPYFKSNLKGVIKGYQDQPAALRAIEGLGNKSILITEDVFKKGEVFQHGVVFHEWGHVVGSPTEEAGVFATELEEMDRQFGTGTAREYIASRSIEYYKQAVVGRGEGVNRLRIILAKLAEGADQETARLISSVVEHLQIKQEVTKAGVAKLESLTADDMDDRPDSTRNVPLPNSGTLQVIDPLPLQEPETGKAVFSKLQKYIRVQVGAGQYRVLAGQDYLNTLTSRKYKAKATEIRGANAQLKLPTLDKGGTTLDPDIRVIGDGHHRFVWSSFHGQPVPFETKNLRTSGQDWSLTYRERS
jgi:hypothetical protein